VRAVENDTKPTSSATKINGRVTDLLLESRLRMIGSLEWLDAPRPGVYLDSKPDADERPAGTGALFPAFAT
jgi:hypothetical protein